MINCKRCKQDIEQPDDWARDKSGVCHICTKEWHAIVAKKQKEYTWPNGGVKYREDLEKWMNDA